MTAAQFLFAVSALLLTPGPTNTLLALSGAAAGFRRSLPLIPAETVGYLLVVLPLALFGAALLETSPLLAKAVKLAAALWVMYLAVRLWQPRVVAGAARLVTPQRVFVTTLLNPKGLVFGLVLLPRPDSPDLAAHFALFLCALLVSAAIWVGAGALLTPGRIELSRSNLLNRSAACWLALLSVGLMVGTLSS